MDIYICLLTGDEEEEEEGGEGGEEGEGEEKMPTCGDYIMHFLTLFWKVLFATIPPAGKMMNLFNLLEVTNELFTHHARSIMFNKLLNSYKLLINNIMFQAIFYNKI